jgi:tRNA-Thr(GGU) m(6)t(6)A37 methyltransferase TsaA
VIFMEPIGRVENKIFKRRCLRKCKETISKIRLESKYTEGLDGIEKYSHIEVIFWMHKVPCEERKRLKVPYVIKGKKIEAGIFSTRVQFRENPMGITLVELVKREENVLMVRGLEAMNRTPVLDIKPYTRHPFNQLFFDTKIRFAPWANKRPAYNMGR